MRRHFCTYFDQNYLSRGLALLRSVERHCPDFTLWVLCLDNDCYARLRQLTLPHVRLIALEELEREDRPLSATKPTRSKVEYYFTCTPALPWYLLKANPDIDMITYLDCDLYFFADPQAVFDEIGVNSIAIIPHRFAPHLRHMERNGIYNVGWLSFRRDDDGLACLGWWRERCLEWCYDRWEENRYADQKYLDDWPTRFRRVAVLQHKGANLAPWNITNYSLSRDAGGIRVDNEPLIFFHFQRFRQITSWLYDTNFANYHVRQTPFVRHEIYEPYLRELRSLAAETPSGVRYRQPLRSAYKLGRSLLKGGCLFYLRDRVY